MFGKRKEVKEGTPLLIPNTFKAFNLYRFILTNSDNLVKTKVGG